MESQSPNNRSNKKTTIAVLTGNSDAQGINTALRAVVRVALHHGAKVFLVRQSLYGLVEGEHNIKEANWFSVSGIAFLAGTVLGYRDCPEFHQRSGKLRAAANLLQRNITSVIAIGEYTTLSAVASLGREWTNLLDELESQHKIQTHTKPTLRVIGIPCCCENLIYGTDLTLGSATTVHQIVQAVDAITTTAFCLHRVFVLEVVGKYSGYVAVAVGLSTAADYIFIPELPQKPDWPNKLHIKLTTAARHGISHKKIIVCEGAMDIKGNIITAKRVAKIVSETIKQNASLIVLGDVQHGGTPNAIDRLFACRMGAEAALAVSDTTYTEPIMICIEGNEITRHSLTRNLEKTAELYKYIDNKDWTKAMNAQSQRFKTYLYLYKNLGSIPVSLSSNRNKCLGVINIGGQCCGMNAAVQGFVKSALAQGYCVKGIRDGLSGLLEGYVEEIEWKDVNGFISQGGSTLGTERMLPDTKISKIAEKFSEIWINALLIIGGFDGYETAIQLTEAREKYPIFRMPICLLPATMSNSVPGTDYSIGTDTALNAIMELCEINVQSSMSKNKNISVVELMGKYCGYLTTIAGLITGADGTYIHEEPFGVQEMKRDIDNIKTKINHGVPTAIVLCSEKANDNISTEFVAKYFAEEGRGTFFVSTQVLGYPQQGRNTSAFDRIEGTAMAAGALEWFNEALKKGEEFFKSPESACIYVHCKSKHQVKPLAEIKKISNFSLRRPAKESLWWLECKKLNHIICKATPE